MFYKLNAHRACKTVNKSGELLARQLFNKLTAFQRSWAGVMAAGAERLSSRWLKALCVTVLTVSSGYCAFLILEGFSSVHKPWKTGRSHHIWSFDPYGIKQQLRNSSGLNMYLDSLEKAAVKDSLNQLDQSKK